MCPINIVGLHLVTVRAAIMDRQLMEKKKGKGEGRTP